MRCVSWKELSEWVRRKGRSLCVEGRVGKFKKWEGSVW